MINNQYAFDLHTQIESLQSLSVIGIGSDWYLLEHKTGRRWTCEALAHPGVLALLRNCAKPIELGQALTFSCYQTGIPFNTLLSIAAELKTLGLITCGETTLSRNDPSWASWEEKGWKKAADFTWQCHVYPKRDYSTPDAWREDCEMMLGYCAHEDRPSNYKIYDGTRKIPLSKKINSILFDMALFNNDLDQKISEEPLTFDAFSRFCYLAFGQTGTKQLCVTGHHVTKTSPSGGSRHPTEVYPIVIDVEGIEPGVYHYNVKDHCLELIKEGNMLHHILDDVVAIPHRTQFQITCSFLYTAVPERSMHRYRESRSYRVLHFDIGHVMKTISMLCRASERPHYSGYSLRERAVEKLLGIDGLLETAIAHTTIG